MTTQTTQNNATLVRSLYNTYNSHQSDPAWLGKGTDPFAEDCEIINVPLGLNLRGPEGYRQFVLGFADAFPGSSTEVINVFATEDQAVVELIGRGTHTGPLHSPAGDIPPTGRKVDLRFCDVYQIRDGKIISFHSYYDALTMMQQLGLIPAMA